MDTKLLLKAFKKSTFVVSIIVGTGIAFTMLMKTLTFLMGFIDSIVHNKAVAVLTVLTLLAIVLGTILNYFIMRRD